jgi:hypothetical protein
MILQILQNISKSYKSNRSLVLLFLFLSISLLHISSALANTGINPQIPYSGTIIQNDGTVLPSSNYRAKFLIYNSSGTVLYNEIRDGITNYAVTGISPALSVTDGRFEILLGSQNPINIVDLNDDSLWLELQLDLNNDTVYEEVFSPRRRIGSAVSAINSIKLVAGGDSLATTSTNNLYINSTGDLVFTGSLERMRILGTGGLRLSGATSGFVGLSPAAVAGNVTYTLPSAAPTTNGQVLSSTTAGVMSWSEVWSLAGNATTTAWNGTTGSRIGTTGNQPLVLATTSATAQDIRFFTGASGANERMRILSTGNVGIGVTAPTARLHLAAGTATASTAPLKFTSGTNLTTAEAGAMEWNGTNLFLTTSGSVRQTINQGLTATATLDFLSTNSSAYTDLTVTVTGAALNDVVALGIPNGSVPAANSNFTAWVSAANTVTVRFNNNSGVAQDPASGSFKVFVTKF